MPETSIDCGVVEIQELFKNAKALRKIPQYAEAILCYDKILEIDSKNINALYEKVHCNFALARWKDIECCVDVIRQLEPNNAFILLDKAHSLVYDDKFDEALEYIDKVVELWPTNSDIWTDRGILLLELDRIDEGLECFKKAILLLPEIDDLFSTYIWKYLGVKGLERLEKLIHNPSISEELLKDAENAIKHIKNREDLMMKCVDAVYSIPHKTEPSKRLNPGDDNPHSPTEKGEHDVVTTKLR